MTASREPETDRIRAAAPEAAPPGRREILIAALLAAAGSLLFVAPIFTGWDRWGIGDWDQHQFFYGVARWSIVERGEWPFWNPFACGGNPALADPQSPSLYPPFLLVLALGVLPGLKILVWLHAALGAFGAWLFGRRVGCGPVAAWLPGAAFGLSSAYALHVATGHATWFAMAWLPPALAGLHAGFRRPRLALLGGAAAAMVVLAGNVYLFSFLLILSAVWAALEAAARRSWRPLAAAALMACGAAGVAAVKILPLAGAVSRVGSLRVGEVTSGDLRLLWHSLLGRDQSLRAFLGAHPSQFWHWWEHGAYVGPVIPFLAFGCALRRIRQVWPMAAVALLALLMALGHGWGAWDVVQRLPVFDSLRVPPRVVVFAVLFLGAMAGLWATEWEAGARRRLVAAGVVLAALDIGWVGRAALREAFVVEPQAPGRGAFHHGTGVIDFARAWDPTSRRYTRAYTDMYPSFLAGRGTINCYDRFHLPIRAAPADLPGGAPNPAYRGEAWIAGEGQARLLEVGGRRLRVAVRADSESTLVVNQNHDPGWSAQDGRPVVERQGLIAAAVTPEDREIVFVYAPPLFPLGAGVSLAAVLGMAAALRPRRAPP